MIMLSPSGWEMPLGKGFTTLHPAAKLAFLVLGPMLDLKLFMMFTRVFRFRLIWTIILCVVVQVFFYSVLVHYFWETYGPIINAPPTVTT